MGKKEKQDNFEEKCDCQDENCDSLDKCTCGEDCKCPPECGCHRGEPCTCGPDCECRKGDGDCGCGCADEECDCEECECDECKSGESQDETCECEHGHHHHHEKHNLAEEYLAMAQRLQADFDNYRKRVAEQLDYQRQEGIKSVVEVFLPCLDAFKEAKKSVKEESTLAGINMVEEKILNAFSSLNVEKIDAVGQKFDPHLHNVIAVLKDESKDDDIILEEYQSGWTMNGKVIRYSKVVVNKKS